MSTKIIAGNATNNGASLSSDTNGVLEIATGASQTTAVTIDASQNVGIGTGSPGYKLQVEGNGQFHYAQVKNTATAANYEAGYRMTVPNRDWLVFTDYTSQALRIFDGTAGAERARIDSSGNLLVGSGTALTYGGRLQVNGATDCAGFNNTYGGTVNAGMITFYRNGAATGGIANTGSTTSYNTSSDYRLKENVQPMTGALEKNARLAPVTYTWKQTGEPGEGFVAHELQAVFPDAVTGKKDAVDAEGNPVYQGIDTSFLVGHLVACVQELKAELDSVKTELNALKGAA